MRSQDGTLKLFNSRVAFWSKTTVLPESKLEPIRVFSVEKMKKPKKRFGVGKRSIGSNS